MKTTEKYFPGHSHLRILFRDSKVRSNVDSKNKHYHSKVLRSNFYLGCITVLYSTITSTMAEYRSETSSFQYGDHLGQNRRHRLNSVLTLRKLPSLIVMRPKRMKVQLFKVANFLWGGGGGVQVGGSFKILRP